MKNPFEKMGCLGAVLIFVVIAVFMAPADDPAATPPMTLQQAEYRGEIESAVKRRLKDPDSAQFVHGVNGCGLVNAKNGFGGYTGRQRFIAQAGGDAAIEDSANDRAAFDQLWREHC